MNEEQIWSWSLPSPDFTTKKVRQLERFIPPFQGHPDRFLNSDRVPQSSRVDDNFVSPPLAVIWQAVKGWRKPRPKVNDYKRRRALILLFWNWGMCRRCSLFSRLLFFKYHPLEPCPRSCYGPDQENRIIISWSDNERRYCGVATTRRI